MQVVKYVFQQHGDERGMLVALEEWKDIPFEIKRVYYLYDTKSGVRRGGHAHRDLEQILVCIHGSCKVLLDSGAEKKIVSLEKPYEGLYIATISGGRCMISLRMPSSWCWPPVIMRKAITFGIMICF